jgi:hypothetical protein
MNDRYRRVDPERLSQAFKVRKLDRPVFPASILERVGFRELS